MMTALCKADSLVKYRRSLVTMLSTIDRRLAWYEANDMLMVVHQIRAANMKREISQCLARLDSNTLISRRYVPGDVFAYVFEGLPAPKAANLTESEQVACDLMRERSRSAMAAQHAFVLQCEIAYRVAFCHFIVFDTLTVSPEYYSRVFSRGSKCFQEYIRGFARLVRDHSYFAVVEAGSKNGRLHIHVLHFFESWVSNPSDPNRFLDKPIKRELNQLKRLWPYGFSVPISVRVSFSDAWSKIGFRWPDDSRTGKGLRNVSPGRVGGYVTKYVLKAYNSSERNEYLWRIRKSHSLGMRILDLFVSQLSLNARVALLARLTVVKFGKMVVPATLLQVRLFKSLDMKIRFELVKVLSPLQSLLQRLRASTLSIEEYNHLNFLCSVIGMSPSEVSSDDVMSEIVQVSNKIQEEYFHERFGSSVSERAATRF